jgi:hypothetical protein
MSISLSREMLTKYLSPVFVETGTYDGGGVKRARECGVSEIHSIELDPIRFKMSQIACEGMPGVHLYEGDTVDILPKIVSSIRDRATIWLDAHPIGEVDTCKIGKFRHPLMQELEIIRKYSLRRDHTILVDDRPEFPVFGTTDERVIEAIKAIHPNYTVYPEPDFRPVIEGRILVAINL